MVGAGFKPARFLRLWIFVYLYVSLLEIKNICNFAPH